MFDSKYMLLDTSAALTEDKNGEAIVRHWMKDVPAVFKLAVTGTISGTAPTLDVKIQESDDNSDWTDVKSFTQVTTTAFVQYIRALPSKKYIRAVADVGGTSPSYGKVQCGIVPAGEHELP